MSYLMCLYNLVGYSSNPGQITWFYDIDPRDPFDEWFSIVTLRWDFFYNSPPNAKKESMPNHAHICWATAEICSD